MDFKQLKNIPNLLSCFRICLVPVFAWIYYNAQTKEQYYLAAAILFVSGVTDALDGYIARKYNMITDLGKILDPFADKLTQAIVAVCLALRIEGMVLLLSLFIIKEVCMILAGGILLKKGAKIEGAKWFGKLSTIIFYLVMFLIVALPDLSIDLVGSMIAISAGFMIFSFLMYIPIFMETIKKTEPKE